MFEPSRQFYKDVQNHITKVVRQSGSEILYQMSLDHFQEPGKMLRPRLVSELGRLLQVDPDHQLKWAAAVEMLHNATLIHDDLQDGDRLRRGRPTMWQKYGAAQAINLGDYLMLLAPSLFLESDLEPHKKASLARLYSRMATEIVNGQSIEPALKSISEARQIENAYMQCISQKTSALFSGVAEGTAVLSSVAPEVQVQLAKIFREIGDLFQIQDDVLDLYGDKKRDQAGSDIKEGKVSYLVVQHLKNRPEDHNFVLDVLKKPRESTTDHDVQSLIKDFEEKGTLDLVLKSIEQKKQAIFRQSPLIVKDFVESFVEEVLSPVAHLFLRPRRVD